MAPIRHLAMHQIQSEGIGEHESRSNANRYASSLPIFILFALCIALFIRSHWRKRRSESASHTSINSKSEHARSEKTLPTSPFQRGLGSDPSQLHNCDSICAQFERGPKWQMESFPLNSSHPQPPAPTIRRHSDQPIFGKTDPKMRMIQHSTYVRRVSAPGLDPDRILEGDVWPVSTGANHTCTLSCL